jgi:uncharacterized protein YcbK (DUF882 family)
MNPIEWKKFKYFVKEEFNSPEKMAFAHIKRLDKFRDNIQTPIIVTSDFRESDTSIHGKGLATDIVFPKMNLDKLYYLYLEAERHNFTGIGIYPHWQLDGKIIGGLHIDSRPPSNGRGARWICIKDETGKQIYLPFTWENMTRYVIL